MIDAGSQTPPIIIKKYANRRLYNTDTSSYITLESLAQMVRENRDFRVVDAKTGEDITRAVLTQIIVEQEAHGRHILPISFLRQLIAMYGDALQTLLPQYLEASMDAFRRNHEQFRKALASAFEPGALAPFDQIARQNVAMIEEGSSGQPSAKGEEPLAEKSRTEELADIRAQMAALQHRLDRLISH